MVELGLVTCSTGATQCSLNCPTALNKQSAIPSPWELCCLWRLRREKQSPTLPSEWAAFLSVSDECGFYRCHVEGWASHHFSEESDGDQRAVSLGSLSSPALKGTGADRTQPQNPSRKVSEARRISRAAVSLCTASPGQHSQEGTSTHPLP